MVDMTFALCVWGALAGVILGVVDRRENPAAPRREALVHPAAKAAFWASCFVGILARGPLGCFLPVALVGIAGLSVVGLKRTVRELLAPSVGWVALAIPLVWYVAAYQVGGEPFLERQILFENVKRFAGGDFVNSEAWWFYGPSVLRTTFPWGVIAVIILIKELRFSRTISYRNLRVVVRWLPLLLLGVGMVLLSLSSGKRHSYLLPLLPLVAVQLGVEFSTLLDRASTHARSRLYLMGRRLEMWLAGVTLVVATVLSLLHAAQVSVYPGFTEGFQAASPVVVRIAPLLVVCGLVGFLLPHRRLRSLYMSVWCVAIIVMSGVLAAGAVVKGYFKGFDLISATWLQTVGEGEELAVFKHPRDEYFDPILLYVRRPVRLINIEKSPFECRQGTVYAAKRAWLDAHEQLFPSPLVRVVTVHERLRARRESAEREVVLFRCGIGDRGAPGGSPILQDARSEGVVFPRSQEAGIPSA
jgi:4-amino-4-deoxy-L-arabinose transferase-like glycosyltransferase